MWYFSVLRCWAVCKDSGFVNSAKIKSLIVSAKMVTEFSIICIVMCYLMVFLNCLERLFRIGDNTVSVITPELSALITSSFISSSHYFPISHSRDPKIILSILDFIS